MSNESNIQALISRATRDLEAIRIEYESSLRAQTIAANLKVDIKNFCENLRSALDYLAHDIRDRYCIPPGDREIFYFPILSNAPTFTQKVARWFPDLATIAPALYEYLESIQPYQDTDRQWLMDFNSLNNSNKHQHLVEQVRHETVMIEAKSSSGGGVVSWNPSGVTFGAGVFINGVPVDPRSQLPVPSPKQSITKTVWVDFKFAEPDVSALPLLQSSLDGVSRICEQVRNLL